MVSVVVPPKTTLTRISVNTVARSLNIPMDIGKSSSAIKSAVMLGGAIKQKNIVARNTSVPVVVKHSPQAPRKLASTVLSIVTSRIDSIKAVMKYDERTV